jgi:hypothetical protein
MSAWILRDVLTLPERHVRGPLNDLGTRRCGVLVVSIDVCDADVDVLVYNP